MRTADLLRLTAGSLGFHHGRSLLSALGIAVGIAAVVLLTSIGSGLKAFVLGEFTQFGTHLMAVIPGKTNTLGLSGAIIGSVRPLSLDDAEALRGLPGVLDLLPSVQGNAAVKWNGRSRRVTVFGTGPAVPRVWRMRVALGRFLPADDPRRARPFAVLGHKLWRALFASRSPLGARIRVGGEAYRVIGVMAAKGQMLGFDLDDSVYLPVGRALALFDRSGLMEIDLLYRPGSDPKRLRERVRRRLLARHAQEDFTLITQDQMLDVLGGILDILTLAVAALGAISLLVGSVGILTIMTIAVRERRAEIGLLRALGAAHGQILGLFLAEAVVLSTGGGLAGVALGAGGAALLGWLLPALPTHTAWGYTALALGVATLIGLLAGVLPALEAARLDPVEALREE